MCVTVYICESGVSSSIYYHTVARFPLISAKFGICTVVGLNGTLVEAKICTMHILVSEVRILASTSVPFRLTTVQMPNYCTNLDEKDYSA